MNYVELPSSWRTRRQRVSFYLAMEEFVAGGGAGSLADTDYFFLWRVAPSVVFGRNQSAEAEVNIGYCRDHGISMFRRKSGGGCIYADEGNVMLSMVTGIAAPVSFVYHRYVMLVVEALRRAGIAAQVSGRNDVMVGGGKVQGNAFYRLRDSSIVHGTLLYDTNLDHMLNAITPDADKLTSKGIESVRQRITLLKDMTPLSLNELMDSIRQTVTVATTVLSEADAEEIARLAERYESVDFVMGLSPKATLVRHRRIDGVGTVEARIEIKHGRIAAVDLNGDFFALQPLDALTERLIGLPLAPEAIREALPEDLSPMIHNLRREDLTDLLCS